MKENEIKDLLVRYVNGECTEDEIIMVETAYLLDNERNPNELSKQDISKDVELVLKSLPQRTVKRKLLPAIAVAASILVCLFAVFYFTQENNLSETVKLSVQKNDIAPGKNTAILTLPNGKTITLSDTKKGVIMTSSQLLYDDGTKLNEKNRGQGYTILNTPKGGQYFVVLPDGTKAILNAATSIKFLSSFKGEKIRSLELSGEAYFEVVKDKAHPFIVKTKNQTVKVLGTHFNISSYPEDESTKTTLLEGSVEVGSLNERLVRKLKPGQQSSLIGDQMDVEDVEIEDAVAWKNGYFMFNYESLEDVMVKLSRWYDIEVRYEDPEVKNTTFFGTISKFEKISKVLNMLERTGVVKFQVKDKVLRVYKKN